MLCVVFRIVRLVKMAVRAQREDNSGVQRGNFQVFRMGQRPLLFGFDIASNATSKTQLNTVYMITWNLSKLFLNFMCELKHT